MTGSPWFAAWAEWVLAHRALVAVALCAVTVGLGVAAQRLTFNPSLRSYLPDGAGSLDNLADLEAHFGGSRGFVLVVEGEVFSAPFVERLEALHDALDSLDVPLPSRSGVTFEGAPHPTESVPDSTPKPAVESESESESEGDDMSDFGEGDHEDDEFELSENSPMTSTDFVGTEFEGQGGILENIQSLRTARRPRMRDGALVVTKVLDPAPAPSELPEVRRDVLSNRLFVGRFVGRAGRHAVVSVRVGDIDSQDAMAVYEALLEVADAHTVDGFRVQVGGRAAIEASVSRALSREMQVLAIAAGIAILVVLAFVFRHPIGVLVPLLIVSLSVVWCLGLMALVGVDVSITTVVLPAFLVVVGLGDSVHVLSAYRARRARGLDNHSAIVAALAGVGVPILFTTLTTCAGLLAFYVAHADAVRQMGLAGVIGMLVALILTVSAIPIALSFNPTSLLGARADEQTDWLSRVLVQISELTAPRVRGNRWGRRNGALIAAVVVTLVSVAGGSQLRVAHDPLSWLGSESRVRQAFETLDAHVGGTMVAWLLIEADGPDGVLNIDVLRRLRTLESHALAFRGEDGEAVVGSVTSVLDFIRAMRRAIRGGARFDALPDSGDRAADQREVFDMAFLFDARAAKQLTRHLSMDRRAAVMTLRLKYSEASQYEAFLRHLDQGLVVAAAGDPPVRIRGAGGAYLYRDLVVALMDDLIRSFGVALGVVSLLMWVVLRSPLLGLLAMVPNLLPTALVLGLMGLFGIPVGLNTLLVASIAIGISVDDTIHLIHTFQHHRRRGLDVESALRTALREAGRAMVSTSLIVVVGFGAFIAGSLMNLVHFGLLVAAMSLIALVMDLLLVPALLRLR